MQEQFIHDLNPVTAPTYGWLRGVQRMHTRTMASMHDQQSKREHKRRDDDQRYANPGRKDPQSCGSPSVAGFSTPRECGQTGWFVDGQERDEE